MQRGGRVLVMLVVAMLMLTLGGGIAAASVDGIHGGTVPETPRTDVPQVVNGRLHGAAQVGNTIVVGGSFTTIRVNGANQNRSGLLAFDATTGALRSAVPSISGTVYDIEAAGGDWAIVAGAFSQVDGTFHGRLARINVVTGAVDHGWNPNANSRVTALTRTGSRLFVGGDFTTVDGLAKAGLAEIDLNTGNVNSGFTMNLSGDLGNGGPVVRELMATPNGQRLVIAHRAATIAGQVRRAAAIVDLTAGGGTLSGWRTDIYPSDIQVVLHDADISPDGSFFVLANAGADIPPSRDTVIALPTAGNGLVQPLWISRHFDSVYGVAVSDAAVYTGGHFCWVEGPLADDPWPGPVGTDHSCATDRNAGRFAPQTVFRDQIAAHDPATGKALAWDPSANGLNGVRMLVTTDRGLLGGSDGDRWGGRTIGRFAFFDTGDVAPPPPPPPPPPPGGDDCVATRTGAAVTLTWEDDGGRHVVRRNGSWLATPGRNVATYTDNNAPAGATYVIRTRVDGVATDRNCVDDNNPEPPPPPPADGCTLTQNGTTITLTWADNGGSHVVRRNDRWVASPGAGTSTFTRTNEPAGSMWVIRTWSGGASTDRTCV